ncbi:MAG: ABC transporter [Candidatus Accumulibacter meliphilus]|jgi:cholesterol transport system auxiliary component|uniref:ABC transporter n=1 Tax=Candidatus Accumulibacter meliphilus TaxID=2211374 RepID=A0A369XVU4_9PROT|nr:MAG: ABC transporter [Candidatus Accumulibacter meliphilus]
MKRRSICLAACLLLAACAGGARNNTPAEVYDFGLPAARLAEGSGWAKLALEIRAAYWFDSPSIEYRLLYDDPLKLRSYAASRWAGAPGLLLAQHLRQQLGLLDSSGRTAVSCLLRLELQEFSQVFETPLLSRGVLQGTARVIDARHQIVAERAFSIEQPAAGADASGGVRALVVASNALGQQLAGWLQELEKLGRLKQCPATIAG